MDWEGLEGFTSKKELSATAIKEAAELLVQGEYPTDDDIAQLSQVLLKLDPEVLYLFFTSDSIAGAEGLAEKIVGSFDVENPAKAGHIYIAAAALERAGRRPEASALLRRFVQTNLPKKAGNKLLYKGFRRAIKYGGDSFLFSRLEDWGDREVNLYTILLTKSAEHLNDPVFAEAVTLFCQNNGKNFVWHGKEQAGKQPNPAESKPKTAKSGDIPSEALDPGEILKLLEKRVASIQAENLSKGKEIENLRAESLALKGANMNLTSEAETLKAQNQLLTEKSDDLESKVNALSKELAEERRALEQNRVKLSNVESAFGQAGQTEIDALKGNLRKRLEPEYRKYTEIRDKTPDLMYYEILMAVLEDVFRALKKNGITFSGDV